jgi:hypothetical protein
MTREHQSCFLFGAVKKISTRPSAVKKSGWSAIRRKGAKMIFFGANEETGGRCASA